MNKRFFKEYLHDYLDISFFKYFVKFIFHGIDESKLGDNYVPFDFRIEILINTEEYNINKTAFYERIDFFDSKMYKIVPRENIDWFYINTYVNDFYPEQQDSMSEYYQKYGDIKNRAQVIVTIDNYYIKAEAYRTIVYMLKNNIILNKKNFIKYYKNILNQYNNSEGWFESYLGYLLDLMNNKKLIEEFKKDYKIYENPKYIVSFNNQLNKLSEELMDGAFLIKEDFLGEGFYKLIDIKQEELNEVLEISKFKKLLETISYNLPYLSELEFIKTDITHPFHYKIRLPYSNLIVDLSTIKIDNKKTNYYYLENFTYGLHQGLTLVAAIKLLIKKHGNKKSRALKALEKVYWKDHQKYDMSMYYIIKYFLEHNAHDILFVIVSISGTLGLTYSESIKLTHILEFYKNESAQYKKGKFYNHFKFLQASINSNFQYLI